MSWKRTGFSVLHADVPPGSSWYGDAGTAIRNCRALIAVITKKYLTTPYCSSELYTADKEGKKLYFAFLEDIDYGASDPARAVQYLASKTNWTTSFMFKTGVNDNGTSLGNLIKALKGKTKPRVEVAASANTIDEKIEGTSAFHASCSMHVRFPVIDVAMMDVGSDKFT